MQILLIFSTFLPFLEYFIVVNLLPYIQFTIHLISLENEKNNGTPYYIITLWHQWGFLQCDLGFIEQRKKTRHIFYPAKFYPKTRKNVNLSKVCQNNYSRVSNKRSPMLIKFWTFSKGYILI